MQCHCSFEMHLWDSFVVLAVDIVPIQALACFLPQTR